MPSGHTCLIRFSPDVSYLETCFVPQMLRAAEREEEAERPIVPASCCFSNVFLLLLLLICQVFLKDMLKNIYLFSATTGDGGNSCRLI